MGPGPTLEAGPGFSPQIEARTGIVDMRQAVATKTIISPRSCWARSPSSALCRTDVVLSGDSPVAPALSSRQPGVALARLGAIG